MTLDARRLVIVSNRLPVVVEDGPEPAVHSASGGLVTALAPVLRNRGGIWIGWPGAPRAPRALLDAAGVGYTLEPVFLSPEEQHEYYDGFANGVIWPLFHDLHSRCTFDPAYWAAYRRVNRAFAEVTARHAGGDAYVWVHDYHLMGVGAELRHLGVASRIGFFLHTPFPPLDIFVTLPWRAEVLRSLLEYDLVGFQTMRDRRNFLQCVRALIPGVEVGGRGHVAMLRAGREVRVGAFPIGIDVDEFAAQAATPEVADEVVRIQAALPQPQILLGVDRLDYTKGIPHRLRALRAALARDPDLRGRVTLVQVVVPSRETVPEYASLKTEIEQAVGEINGEFTTPGWVPVHYLFRRLPRTELLAYYRAAEVALVTPLKDGMNLVAKEFCAVSVDEDRVLILSEFAGAAAQLQRGALLVNPYDVDGVADAIRRAVAMPVAERRDRMRRMRRTIRQHDIGWWVDAFLRTAFARRVEDFPLLGEALPAAIPELAE